MSMQELRAAYNMAHAVGSPHAGWHATALPSDRESRLRPRFMKAGLRGKALEDALYRAGAKGQKWGVSANDQDIIRWAMNQGMAIPGVNRALSKMQQDTSRKVRGSQPLNPLDRLLQEAQAAHNQAKAANEARYGQGLGLLQDSYARNTGALKELQERIPGYFDTYGQTAKALNEERFADNNALQLAYLQKRGLTNSTIMPSFSGANEKDLAIAQGAIDEQKARAQAEMDARIAQIVTGQDHSMIRDQANWIQARHDQGPDYGQIMKLAEAYGQGNAGQGFDRSPNVPRGGFGGAAPRGAAPVMAGGGGLYGGIAGNPAGFLGGLMANHGAQSIGYTPRQRPQQHSPEVVNATGAVAGPLAAMLEAVGGKKPKGKAGRKPYSGPTPMIGSLPRMPATSEERVRAMRRAWGRGGVAMGDRLERSWMDSRRRDRLLEDRRLEAEMEIDR